MRIDRSKGFTGLGVSVPEEGSKTDFRNVEFLKSLEEEQSPINELLSVSHTATSKPVLLNCVSC